jgi:hypothetical protein
LLTLDAKPLAEAQGFIETYRSFWEDSLAALDKYVTSKREKRK